MKPHNQLIERIDDIAHRLTQASHDYLNEGLGYQMLAAVTELGLFTAYIKTITRFNKKSLEWTPNALNSVVEAVSTGAFEVRSTVNEFTIDTFVELLREFNDDLHEEGSTTKLDIAKSIPSTYEMDTGEFVGQSASLHFLLDKNNIPRSPLCHKITRIPSDNGPLYEGNMGGLVLQFDWGPTQVYHPGTSEEIIADSSHLILDGGYEMMKGSRFNSEVYVHMGFRMIETARILIDQAGGDFIEVLESAVENSVVSGGCDPFKNQLRYREGNEFGAKPLERKPAETAFVKEVLLHFREMEYS